MKACLPGDPGLKDSSAMVVWDGGKCSRSCGGCGGAREVVLGLPAN